uniref:Uncharacterized protein n=1 Tax=Magallana gigas TaxID=29159 RepID=K1Q1D0_MAGGI
MAWGLEEEDGEIFIIINGKKAISTESLEEFGPVEYVDPGRSADELWVKDPAEFHQEQIEDLNIPMIILGGNHLLTACRELLQEEPENEIFSCYQILSRALQRALKKE